VLHAEFFSKKYRIGTLCFCSRLCKSRYEHKQRAYDEARRKWFVDLAHGGP